MMQKPDILIFGQGYVGHELKDYFGNRSVLSQLKTTDPDLIRQEILNFEPQIVVNCVGKTDTAALEQGRISPLEGYLANCHFAALLALTVNEIGKVKLQVHFSTGMMYDGVQFDNVGWSESAKPGLRQSVYTRQKLLAEQALCGSPTRITGMTDNLVVLRIHQPFSATHYPGKNLLTKLESFQSYLTEPSSMTCLKDCFALIDQLADKDAPRGIIHATNPGRISAFEIAQKMKALGLLPPDHEILTMTRLALNNFVNQTGGAYQPMVALRTEKLTNNLSMRPIHQAIDDTLNKMVELQAAPA